MYRVSVTNLPFVPTHQVPIFLADFYTRALLAFHEAVPV